jgi:N-acetylmuramoyl-L-alanine amidase
MNTYTVVLPAQVKAFTDVFMLALCIYREARGESQDAKQAVGWAVRNRVEHPSWYGKDWFSVITKPFQFSSFNRGEVNSIVFGAPEDVAWAQCVQAAFDVIVSNVPDATGGATFYYDRSLDKKNDPPKWAALYVHTADVGNFHFFKPQP